MEVRQVDNPDVQRRVEDIIRHRINRSAYTGITRNTLGICLAGFSKGINIMNIPVSEVNSIISFYACFRNQRECDWCQGTACYVQGIRF